MFPRTIKGNSVSNQKMNKHIKEIGKIVGINRLVSKPRFNIEGKIIIVNESDIQIPLYDTLTTHII